MNRLIVTLLIFLFPNSAFAYIDPGTGSFILQAILALFASVAVFFGYQLKIAKSFFKKLFKIKEKKQEIDKKDLS